MGSKSAGIGLYEFLIDAELQHYYSALKNELKVQNVSQLKYVSEEDMIQIGMSRPEMRRLTKFFHKHCPQTYLAKMKKKLLQRRDESLSVPLPSQVTDHGGRSVRTVAPGRHIIQADAIVSHKTLGQGEFGTVQQGVWTSEEGERIQVAIKCLSQERMENNPVEFLKEAAIMHSVDHDHIVRLYGVVLDTTSLVLVTELAPLRSLLECLKEQSMRPNLTQQTLFDFSIQICDGMEYLESKRLIHRDLAARNILVFSKTKVKISDFGLSRALGVGKDYYQTNFNANLKLPIAWCAPECINFLRFTSASDVWAYGVTLWEMYSYGFQPWAALTGQQILEGIDEPNFHRLERPELASVEVYTQIMLKCWQHSPSDRPTFAQLLNILPEYKPEQVQAIRESGGGRRDLLVFEPGDLITVIDKKPVGVSCVDGLSVEWKGVLKCGKSGLFNPNNTITYLGPSLPSARDTQRFQRNDSRSGSLRKGRLSADMISPPQGDFKHTGHVGPDGNFFGDIAFINTKSWVPRQVVPPYKPEVSRDDFSLVSNGHVKGQDSDSPISCRDTDPLLWENQKEFCHKNRKKLVLPNNGSVGNVEPVLDHEYHEISDEENEMLGTRKGKGHSSDLGLSNPALSSNSHSPLHSPFEKAFELGPSLMDEVFGALERERVKEECGSPDERCSSSSFPTVMNSSKKKFATVKPISSKDRKRLDHAIAIANELASRSMLELDHVRNSTSFDDISSPTNHNSPPHRKIFSFLPGSKGNERERRNYTQEAASIPDIQSTISEEAKEVYNSLIEKPSSIGSLGVLTPSFENKSSSFNFPEKCVSKKSAFFDQEPLCPPTPSPFFDTVPLLASSKMAASTPPSKCKDARSRIEDTVRHRGRSESWNGSSSNTKATEEAKEIEPDEEEDRNPLRLLRQSKGKVPNALPLPPKKGDAGQGHVNGSGQLLSQEFTSVTKSTSTHPRHQRKHPLLVPPKVQVPFCPSSSNQGPPPPPPKPQRQNVSLSTSPPNLGNKFSDSSVGHDPIDSSISIKANQDPQLGSVGGRLSILSVSSNVPLYENYEETLKVNSNGSESNLNGHEVNESASELSQTPKLEVEICQVKMNTSNSMPATETAPPHSGSDSNFNAHQEKENNLPKSMTAEVGEVGVEIPVTKKEDGEFQEKIGIVMNESPVKSLNEPNQTISMLNPKIKTVQRILGSSASECECQWALDLCRDDSAHAVKLLRLKCLLPTSLLESDIERVVSVLEMSHWDVARASDFLLNPTNQRTRNRISLRNLQRRESSSEENTVPTIPEYITPTRV